MQIEAHFEEHRALEEPCEEHELVQTNRFDEEDCEHICKKHGVGARKLGGGRVDKFKHVKIRLKAWLEKEREMGHFVDKTDLVMEFMEQCADESEACEAEVKRRAALEEPVLAIEDAATEVPSAKKQKLEVSVFFCKGAARF